MIIRNLTADEQLLLAFCRIVLNENEKREIRDLMKEIYDWKHFVSLANEHGIVALSYYNISNSGNQDLIPPEYLRILHLAYLKNLAHNTYLYSQLSNILEIIRDKEMTVVLLKGMALEKTIYGNRGLRQMTDIDILVDQDFVMELRRIFIQRGFKSDPFKSPLYKYLIPYLNNHIPRLSKEDCHLEIHYKLFDQKDNFLTEKFLELSTPVKIDENTAFVPPPQLFFLYLISHLDHHLTSGDAQLRMYADIYILLSDRYDEIINLKLLDYATEVNLEKRLAGILFLMNKYMNISFPGWLNDYILRSDHTQETDRFLSFLKDPMNPVAKRVSARYMKQIEIIPGIHRQALYIIGFIFPSLSFMKKRYRTRSLPGALLNYPLRWGKSAGLFIISLLKARRYRGKKVN